MEKIASKGTPSSTLLCRDIATMNANEGDEIASVSATNGELRPDPAAIATPGKRKRSTQEEKSSADSTSNTSHDKANLQENLRSLVGLLSK